MARRRTTEQLQRSPDTTHALESRAWSFNTPSSAFATAPFQSQASGAQQQDPQRESDNEHNAPVAPRHSLGQFSIFPPARPAAPAAPAPPQPSVPASAQMAQEPAAETDDAAQAAEQQERPAPRPRGPGAGSPRFGSLHGLPVDPPPAEGQGSGAGGPIIQARLTVSQPNDPFEQEAERVAHLVNQPGGADAGGLAGGKHPLAIQPARAGVGAGLGAVSPEVEAAIGGLRGGGQPLPAGERSFFESRFGYRFDDVHIHTGPQAARLSQTLNAQAFTVGRDIAFAEGAYAPGSSQGRHLLAHELTHVVQQTGGDPAEPADAPDSTPASSEHVASAPAQVAPMVARTPAPEGEVGVCPVCGRLGKGTCPDCGQPFVAIQRTPAAPDALPRRAPQPGAPDVQRLGWDDVASFGKGVLNGAGDLASMGAEGFAALVGKIAPGLAELIRNGPAGTLAKLITEGVQSLVKSLFGQADLGAVVEQLTGGFNEVFTGIKGLLTGDPAGCGAFTNTLNTLRNLVHSFIDNPLVNQVKQNFAKLQGALDQVNKLVLAPVFDTLMSLGGGLFDGIKSFAATIAGWGGQIRNVLGAAWDWVKQQLGLGGGADDQGGIFEWLKAEASKAWQQIKQTVEPVVGPLKTVGMVLLAFTPVGPIYLLVTYGPKILQAAEWVAKNMGDPEIIKKSHQEMGDTILPQILETLQGLGQTATQVASELLSSSLQLGHSVAALLDALAGIPLLSPIHGPIQLVANGIERLTTWAQTNFGDVGKDIEQINSAVKRVLNPFIEVLNAVGEAVAHPENIPSITNGSFWARLPDCYKVPIIDFLLDIGIMYLRAAPDLPIFGLIWPLVKNGVLGFLEGLRAQDPAVKLKVSNRIANIISGSSASFVVGFIKGLLKGIWEGLTDPFTTAYTLLTGLGSVVSWLMQASGLAPAQKPAVGAPQQEAPAEGAPAEAADAGAAEPEDKGLEQRAPEMAEELRPPVESVTGGFMPAVGELFSGGEGMTFEDLEKKLGAAWSGLLGAMRSIGGQLADALCDFFMKKDADAQIGESLGWLAGTVAVQVVLDILTAGTIEALRPLQGLAKLLNWTNSAMEGVFKVLGKLGGVVLDGLAHLRKALGEAAGSAIQKVFGALDEIGTKLITFGEELLGLAGKGAGKADDVAGKAAREGLEYTDDALKAGGKTADKLADSAKLSRGERDILEQTAAKRGSQLTDAELDTELGFVRRNQPHPIAEGDYVEAVDLPNGHEWKRHKDGKWCRFSEKPDICVLKSELEMRGRVVPPLEKTLEHALNPEAYLNAIVKKYRINLRGSGVEINIFYDPAMRRGTLGLTREVEGGRIIRIGPDALADEATAANTIAHELNHARDYIRGGKHKPHGDGSSIGDGTVYGSGNALEDYIKGRR